MRFGNGGTATGGRRFWFVWYCSLPCKLTHAPHCFHLEARCQGRSVLRQIGFEKFRTFDLVNFWHRHLDHLYDVDLEVLGRYDLNRLTGARRRKPLIDQARSFSYNVHQGRGRYIYRRAYYARSNGSGGSRAQYLVDWYGRGPFLTHVDASP